MADAEGGPADGTRDVTQTIAGVSEGAGETGRAADQVLQAANDLSRQSNSLRGVVDTFLSEVRAM